MDEALEESVESFMRSLQPYSFAYLDLIGQVLLKTWTPTLTFATPGDLSVTYSERDGTSIRMGPLVLAFFRVTTSAFTHTTASGAVALTGLPYKSRTFTTLTGEGNVRWRGITKANYTDVGPLVAHNVSQVTFTISGSGQAAVAVAAADMPTGGTVAFAGLVAYFAQ